MKATLVQTLSGFNGGRLKFDGGLVFEDLENRQLLEPVRARSLFELEVGHPAPDDDELWVFRNRVVFVKAPWTAHPSEILTAVKHLVMSQEKTFSDMARAIELFDKLETTVTREPIPADVRTFVWRRDQGRCVQCGSNHKLEFDHIIPVVRGGGNTERNIQLLCEGCNRSKGALI